MPDPVQLILGVVQRTPIALSSDGIDLFAKIHFQLSKETCRLTKGRYLVTPVQGMASNATQM